jgi:hypothetical protein
MAKMAFTVSVTVPKGAKVREVQKAVRDALQEGTMLSPSACAYDTKKPVRVTPIGEKE